METKTPISDEATKESAKLTYAISQREYLTKISRELETSLSATRAECEEVKAKANHYVEVLAETFERTGTVACMYPYCGCDGARLCESTLGPSKRALAQNTEGEINPGAAFPWEDDAAKKELVSLRAENERLRKTATRLIEQYICNPKTEHEFIAMMGSSRKGEKLWKFWDELRAALSAKEGR